jgi:uncharacterized protein YbjT (DUF2867 family)
VKIAVTGGTGFVGRAFIARALESGHSLQALARSAQEPRPGVAWIAGDLSDRAALAELVHGVDAVVHIAGVVNAPDAAGFETGNVTGTLNMVEVAATEGVQRFVHVSSLSAREPELSAYGASKARGEKVVKASLLDWTVVRPPAIYGPYDKELFELFRAARWGVVPVPKDGRASLIQVDDLARLLLALLPGGQPVSGRVFEPDDGRPGAGDGDRLGGRPAAQSAGPFARSFAQGCQHRQLPARQGSQDDARPRGLFQPSRLDRASRGACAGGCVGAEDRDPQRLARDG